MDVKTTFLNGELDEEVDLKKEFLSSRFSMKEMREADVILVSTTMNTSEKLMLNNDQVVSQLECSMMIGCLMYAMTCTRLILLLQWFVIYWISISLEGSINTSWINNPEDNSSISGWVFLLGGAIGKEAKRLRNLILEISLWSNLIAPISMHCDIVSTLAKAYRQIYSEKPRHLGAIYPNKVIEDSLNQKKLHEPLAEAKPISMKVEDWTLLDRKALGVVTLSLAKNVAYNVVNEMTTYDLIKALFNMYEKPSASNKVFLIRQLVNTKMKEGASIEDHVNEFNSILSRKDICRKTFEEYLNSLLSEKDKGGGRKQDRGQKKNKGRSKSKKRARDYDEALVFCVENTVEERIMDYGASFHANFFKEELERFRLRSGKTLKDVRYIPGLKRRLISIGQLKRKVTMINTTIYGKANATLWHQRLRHMSVKGIKILASKGRILDLQKVVVGFCEPCVLLKQKNVNFIKSWNTRKLQMLELVHTDVYGPTFVASIDVSHYYVTFIDDNRRKVKCLNSDNGGENGRREFFEYCAENRIKMLKQSGKHLNIMVLIKELTEH
uniref:Retrovirus-related Pol polyprotein from transposon TNT 1-94 n=1 Tax=Tanacetum cinerariifolium TaxID=118510 RepID=A0A6L2KH43_TANCI|nr:retrovirus-related Pol polyprotein from transposon TNT 1-94 [Tanacetum cinerariifolium]